MRTHRMPMRKVVRSIRRSDTLTFAEWRALSDRVKERDNYTCRKCGKHKSQLRSGEFLEAHHIKRRADGGTNSMLNLITLCSACHKRQPGHDHLR